MTITVYRIAKLKYEDQMFSGLGGLYADGRWTRRGRPVVYTSENVSLAVLEYTVNYRRRGWVLPSVLGRANLSAKKIAIATLNVRDLPRNWSDPDPPAMLRMLGQEWLERGATAVLKVPSAVVTEEWNYLLNPLHPDFKRLAFGKSKQFLFHRRVAKARRI